MAVSVVGHKEAATTKVALPAGIEAGDTELTFAYRNGSTTAPTVPAGYNAGEASIAVAFESTNSAVVATRRLAGSETETGTFTNATQVVTIVLRGARSTLPIGHMTFQKNTGTTIETPALPMQNTSGSSAVIAFAGTKSTNANGKTLSSTTALESSQTATNLAYNLSVTSWAKRAYSATVNASVSIAVAVEILPEEEKPVGGAFKNFKQAITPFATRNGTTTATMPDNIKTGDRVVVWSYQEAEASGEGATATEGWTRVESSFYSAMAARGTFWECASYNGKPLVWTYSGNRGTAAVAIAFQGSSGRDTNKVANATALSTTQTYPEITTSVNEALVMYIDVNDTSSYKTADPTGSKPWVDIAFQGFNVFLEKQTTAGKSGTNTVTVTPAMSSIKLTVAFKPEEEPKGEAKTVEVADEVTLSDSVKRAVGKGLADAVTLGDAVTRGVVKTQPDTITLSDAQQKNVVKPAAADGVSLSDNVTRAAGLQKSDSLTISDATLRNVVKGVADAVAVSDSVKTISAFIRKLEDGVTLSDGVIKAPALNKADGVTIEDSTPLKNVGKGVADTLTISDVVAKAFVKSGLADSVTLADAVKKAVGKVLADETTLSDSVKRAVTMRTGDSVTIEDAVSRVAHFLVAVNDSVTISDAVKRAVQHLVADEVAVADAVKRAVGKSVVDSLAISDAVRRAVALAVDDTLTISDLVNAHLLQVVERYARLGFETTAEAEVVITEALVEVLTYIALLELRGGLTEADIEEASTEADVLTPGTEALLEGEEREALVDSEERKVL